MKMTKMDDSNNYQYDKVPTKENLRAFGETKVPLKYGYGIRHIQLVLVFLSLSMNFITRGHLGVTIVAMTSTKDNSTSEYLEHFKGNATRSELFTNDTLSNNVTTVDDLGVEHYTNKSLTLKAEDDAKKPWWYVYRTYDWPKPVQEMVLSSFFLGYCIMMFPTGIICQRWGGKLPLQVSLFVNGVVTFLTPWVAMWGGWKAVCFCRTLQGLSQAGTFPCVQTLLSKWVPSNERASLTSYVYSGTTIGTVVAFQIGGLMADSKWGWPSTFWAVGLLSIVAFAILTIFGEDSPLNHKTISEDEKNYILGHIDDGIVQKRTTPWKAMMTSKPLWGCFATHIGSSLTFVYFLTQVPSYIHYVLGINVKGSGLLSSLPYIASFFTCIGFGILSDYCTNNKIVSVKNARRIFNSISQFGNAAALIGASFANSTSVAIACLVLGMACHMGVHTGWMVNHIDLAPNYSGTMMAIGNTMMNVIVLILPVVVSNIVIDVRDHYQWRIMMSLVAGFAVIGNTVFVLLMSSETQPWNDTQTYDLPLQETELEATKEKEQKH